MTALRFLRPIADALLYGLLAWAGVVAVALWVIGGRG